MMDFMLASCCCYYYYYYSLLAAAAAAVLLLYVAAADGCFCCYHNAPFLNSERLDSSTPRPRRRDPTSPRRQDAT